MEMTWGYDSDLDRFVCLANHITYQKQEIDPEFGIFRLESQSSSVVSVGRAFARKIGSATLFVYYG